LTGFGGPQKATAEIGELDIPFDDYPKPTGLIKYFVQMNEGRDFICLDFFAGSGTTAHAVLDLNKQDGGNRKFILVQLPEPCAPDSAAYRAGFKSISAICSERVRRVIKQLNSTGVNELALSNTEKSDRGFRLFNLADSNFKAWNAKEANSVDALAKQLTLHINHLQDGRTSSDILFEILVKSGFQLTARAEKLSLGGLDVFSVAGDALLVCLERKPERVVCLDEGFAGNDQLKTNAVQSFKAKGVVFRTV
jgi:adenine-specific DNA-methyltransferase